MNEPISPAQIGPDYTTLMDECRREMRARKIGLAQWLVVEVIFDYGFAVDRADAWIPSLEVFALRTGMGKKEIGEALSAVESYGMLEWEPAPDPAWPAARRYKIFPMSTRVWSISARVPNRRLQTKAATIDRWLRALNACGGPAQGEFFPPQWDHADTLAEWQATTQSATPDASADRGLPPRQAARPSFSPPEPMPPSDDASTSRGATFPGAPDPVRVGKNPTRGEKPHAPLHGGYESNERQVSHYSRPSIEMSNGVGKNPTACEEDGGDGDGERQPHWCSREIENGLYRRLRGLMGRYYAPPMAALMMDKFGGIWRWRIRESHHCVEHAMDLVEANWKEIKKSLGGTLNSEWGKIWKRTREKLAQQQHAEEEREREAARNTQPTTGE